MALEPCPHCGREFDHDNAGARQNHVDSCEREKQKFQQSQGGQPQEAQAQPPQPAQAPAQPPQAQPQPQAGQQGGGNLPAIAEQQSAEVGMALGQSIVSPWMSDDPTEREIGKARGLKTLAGMMFSAAEEKEQKAQKGRQRAEQHAGQEIQPTEQLPICGVCEGQLPNMPESGTFGCPHCGTVLQA